MVLIDMEEDNEHETQSPSRQPPSSFTATPRARAPSIPEQSRWSTSTFSSVAPSRQTSASQNVRQSLPPLPTARDTRTTAQNNVPIQTMLERSTRHDRNSSAPSAWRPPPTFANPSRTSSEISVARSLSASSREIPIMLQINEDAPPVPPIPEHQSVRPIRTSLSDVNLSSQPNTPASPLPRSADEHELRSAAVRAPLTTYSGPDSTLLASPSEITPQRLRSRYFVGDSLSRTKSAAPALMPGLPPTTSPTVPPPPKTKTVTGPPPSYKPPRQISPARPDVHVESRPSTNASNSSLLSRIGTNLRKSLRNPGRYHKIDDGNEPQIPMNPMRGPAPAEGPGDGDFAPIAFDISTFEGPAHLQTRPSTRQQRSRRHSNPAEDDTDILESKGQLTGGLGGGMDAVMEASVTMPPNYKPSLKITPNYKSSLMKRTTTRWRKQPPASPNPLTQAGQEAAVRSGHVVAIEEGFVDLSNVEGGMGGGSDTPKDINLIADEAAKQSYYFPPDPQMPNWRPLPMQPWYLILLLCIAITFFGIVEHLVQASKNKGLITFQSPSEVPNGQWFVWKYLGEILVVSYGVMFQATDFEVRRLEPYYQMSRPTGAKAPESLNMDYLTFWSYLIPFKAIKHKQWAVTCSSLCTIMASAIMPVLYSAAVNLNPPRSERKRPPGAPPITFQVQFDPIWSRVMETFLALIIISAGLLLFQQRRKSGLNGDLKGVAGIATMATKSHILNDFRGLDQASHQAIHKQLAHRRFILHKGSLWQGEYITRNGAETEGVPKPKNPHPVALHLPVGVIFMFCLVLFSVLVPIFEFNESANKVTDAAPWFLPLLATLLKLAWTNLETGVRMIEPFYRLSKRHAHPSVLLLDYTGTIPGAMPVKAFFNRHFLLGAVGIGALLGEILTVCVSSFNVDGQDFLTDKNRQVNNTGLTKRTFFSSLAVAEAIPIIMIVILIFVYMRRRHPFLPRQPGTIASVLAFVHQSKMLYSFVAPDDDEESPTTTHHGGRKESFKNKPLSKSWTMATFATATNLLGSEKDQEMGIAERAVHLLEHRGKTFGLGWYRGRDGQDHVGIDEEELLHDYEHGVDWSKSHMGADIGRWEQL